MQNKEIGKIGEIIAAKHLRAKGYKILRQNLTLGKLEIDLVAQTPEGKILIVEVKSIIGSPETHRPEDNYNYQKSKNIRAAAQKFLGRYPQLITEAGVQIDLIAINLSLEEGSWRSALRHYENL